MGDLVVAAGVSALVEPSTRVRTVVPAPVHRPGTAEDHAGVPHG